MSNSAPLKICKADYLDGLRLRIHFNDGVDKIVNFSDFLNSKDDFYTRKYRNTANFRKFKIENGNIVWGKDWELIFPIKHLRKGNLITP